MIAGRMVVVGSPAAMKRGMGPIVKDALQEAGGLWHRRYLRRHFETGAAGRYHYERRRSDKYKRRKRRMKGHTRPLEFSGDLKRQALRMAEISGTSKRARVKVSVPWYVTARMTRRRMPDMAKELTATTRAEVGRLARVIEQIAERKLNQIQTRETRS